MDIYDYLYDEEIVRKNHEAHIFREAKEKGKAEIAANMIHMTSMTNEQISEITGLEIDKINELRQNASC